LSRPFGGGASGDAETVVWRGGAVFPQGDNSGEERVLQKIKKDEAILLLLWPRPSESPVAGEGRMGKGSAEYHLWERR